MHVLGRQTRRIRLLGWIDLVVLVLVLGIFAAMVRVADEWRAPSTRAVEIDLSFSQLPLYTLYSMSRGVAAYGLSLLFTLLYGYWAAHDARARRVLLPLLDVLQSIPVLGFMPGLVLALVTAFPRSNVGLELAAVVMIFTGQVWNMTFSFYASLRSVPQEQRELAAIFGFGWWRTLRCIELPGATVALVWNSMMSMAGGWFFLMINESFRLGESDFRLPGLGAYMSVAADQGRADAMAGGVASMVLMIVAVDQLFWRPVVVWAQRFRIEDVASGEQPRSWFLSLLRRARFVRASLREARREVFGTGEGRAQRLTGVVRTAERIGPFLSTALLIVLAFVLVVVADRLIRTIATVPPRDWGMLVLLGGLTLMRVLAAVLLGTLWAVPVGIVIGLSPALSRFAQPVIQVAASFPAPMLFPVVIAFLHVSGVPLGWGSVVLLLLGTQWYILFNVVAGASAIPADLREMAHGFRLPWRRRLTAVYLPCVFPYLVTGWITAAGGAWNASIVAEFVQFHGATIETPGLGQSISRSALSADFGRLTAGVCVMSLIVVMFNRLVWRECSRLAEQRYSLNR